MQHVLARSLYSTYESRFTDEIARSRPAKIARVSPATAAPPPAKVSPPIKLPVLDERLRISSSKLRPVLSALHDVPIDLAVAQSPGPPRRRHHPALVTRQPSKVAPSLSTSDCIYDHYPHRQRRRHILAASSPLSSRPWYPRLASPVPSSRRGQAPRSGIVEDRASIIGSAATSPSPLRSATRNLPPSRAEIDLPIQQAAGRDKGPSTSSCLRGGPE